MKAIQAVPKKIMEIFSTDNYLIPDFQRPYTWVERHCEALWVDIVDFHNLVKSAKDNNNTNEEQYFLGNIVLYPNANDTFAVIDGQQRLTTLILLMKALFENSGSSKDLDTCLYVREKGTANKTGELKVRSESIEEKDPNLLKKIVGNEITEEEKNKGKSNFLKNYRYFLKEITDWRKKQNYDSTDLQELIITLLYKVVLLPIGCGSKDDALKIFETINTRGEPLSDADVFKAKLYHSIGEKELQVSFIKDWIKLAKKNKDNLEKLFRILMHIHRAKNDERGREIALRAFFIPTPNPSPLDDWQNIMLDLNKIDSANDWINNDSNDTIKSLCGIMKTLRNRYWDLPLFVFLYKYGNYNDEEGFNLEKKYNKQLQKLLEQTVRYTFVIGIVHNSVDKMKDAFHKICADIALDRNYSNNPKDNEIEDLEEKLKTNDINDFGMYQKGLILLSAYLNSKQSKREFSKFIFDKNVSIEHVLPREWNNFCDGWDQKTHEEYIDSIGNLIPLEKKLNYSLQNGYFRKKKNKYKESVVQDAIDISSLSDSAWTVKKIKDEHERKIKLLKKFFFFF
jgi:hypothetical protein